LVIIGIEPFQVCGGETAKLVGRIVGKALGREDARIVHNMIDRAELTDRGLRDLLGCRCLADVSVDERECGDGAKPALETLRDVARTL
jgi:hypothetical protein